MLRVPDPDADAGGARRAGTRAATATRCWSATSPCCSSRATPADGERPLLNHIALLVDSGQEQLEEARRRGLEVAEVRDAANTFAVFVWGPDRIKLEYVEHKPTFSLV